LRARYDVEVIDLNAELHYKNRRILKPILDLMDKSRTISDGSFLYPFYEEVETEIDEEYAAVSWAEYSLVYVTPPSWFPMVPAESVLRLARRIKEASPRTTVCFLGNSLGSWTNEEELKKHGVQLVHLNDLFAIDADPKPVLYDVLPTPIYENRDKYLFDLLPFALKHGCPWGQCRFCSLSKGWNSGYLERSAKIACEELEMLIDRYNPKALVCTNHSLSGRNLIEFCGYVGRLNKPWCGQSRADLSEQEILALGKAGCKAVFFGLESGSDRTLRALNKGITSKRMSDFIRILHSSGILPAPSVIIGAPGEGRADFEKTVQFLVDHRPYLDMVNLYAFMATPASELGSKKKQPDKETPLRLFQLMKTCEDLGLKVCLGEQSFEYFLFKWVTQGDRVAGWEVQKMD
jgi:radical SAM superfamily enzyme YgiQ (UPF0313 family)